MKIQLWAIGILSLLLVVTAPFTENTFAGLLSKASHGGSGHATPEGRSLQQIEYSEFNHRTAALAVMILGLLGLGTEINKQKRPNQEAWKWFWPSGWLLLGMFLFIRSDPNNWPSGPIGFMETFADPEARQHKIFSLALIALGSLEALRLSHHLRGRGWAFLFPLVAILAGLALGLHSQVHVLNARVYVHHMLGALLGVGIGLAKILHERGLLPSQWGASLWPSLMILFGVQFLFYSEH